MPALRFKQSLLWAAIGSVFLHVVMGIILVQGQLLSWEPMPITDPNEQALEATMVLDAAPMARAQSAGASPAPLTNGFNSQVYQDTPTPATQTKPSQDSPPEEPKQQAAPGTTPITTINTDKVALPYEELVQKKETLPPAAVSTPPAAHYSLPSKALLQYEGKWGGTTVRGNLVWSLLDQAYDAQLQITAKTILKIFEIKLTSQGMINDYGIDPNTAQEKGFTGSTTAIHINAAQKQVVISRKEGFLPYTAGGKDLLALIVQLGMQTQAQPAWRNKGTAQDFTVYRPSGIKRWRYQSQGIDTLTVGAVPIDTVYIKRVPLANSTDPDYEYIHHLWLDPARHGLPVRITLENPKNGQTIELNLTHWEETP